MISREFVILDPNIKENKNIGNCTDTLWFNKRCVGKSLFLANALATRNTKQRKRMPEELKL